MSLQKLKGKQQEIYCFRIPFSVEWVQHLCLRYMWTQQFQNYLSCWIADVRTDPKMCNSVVSFCLVYNDVTVISNKQWQGFPQTLPCVRIAWRACSCGWLGSTCRASESGVLVMPQICIPNWFPGGATAACSETALWEPLLRLPSASMIITHGRGNLFYFTLCICKKTWKITMGTEIIFLNFILFIFLYSRILLVIYFIHISVYMSIPISQFITPPPPPPATFAPGVHTFVLYICVSISVLQTGSSVPFSRFHIYAIIYDICFSLSDLLHSVWQSLDASTSLQMTQFCSFLWLSNIPLYICTTSSLSIRLLMGI